MTVGPRKALSLFQNFLSKVILGQQTSAESCPGGTLWVGLLCPQGILRQFPPHPWRRLCSFRTGFVWELQRSGYSGLTTSGFVINKQSEGSGCGYWFHSSKVAGPGLCDALGLFLIVSSAQIPSPYSDMNKERMGNPESTASIAGKQKHFQKSHTSHITAQNSIT